MKVRVYYTIRSYQDVDMDVEDAADVDADAVYDALLREGISPTEPDDDDVSLNGWKVLEDDRWPCV